MSNKKTTTEKGSEVLFSALDERGFDYELSNNNLVFVEESYDYPAMVIALTSKLVKDERSSLTVDRINKLREEAERCNAVPVLGFCTFSNDYNNIHFVTIALDDFEEAANDENLLGITKGRRGHAVAINLMSFEQEKLYSLAICYCNSSKKGSFVWNEV